MSLNSGMFSSKYASWTTPKDLFERLDKLYEFTLDAAASRENALCEKYYTARDNALSMDWENSTFLNPPYGSGIKAWIDKSIQEAGKGKTVVCLVPARTDTKWWQGCWSARYICFLRGRLKFGNGANTTTTAPFPSAIVVFTSNILRPAIHESLSEIGKVVHLGSSQS